MSVPRVPAPSPHSLIFLIFFVRTRYYESLSLFFGLFDLLSFCEHESRTFLLATSDPSLRQPSSAAFLCDLHFLVISPPPSVVPLASYRRCIYRGPPLLLLPHGRPTTSPKLLFPLEDAKRVTRLFVFIPTFPFSLSPKYVDPRSLISEVSSSPGNLCTRAVFSCFSPLSRRSGCTSYFASPFLF